MKRTIEIQIVEETIINEGLPGCDINPAIIQRSVIYQQRFSEDRYPNYPDIAKVIRSANGGET